MKKLAVFLGTALLVTMSWAPAHAASAGSSKGKRASLHIDYKTSTIYQYDGSPNGTGPTVPATLVSATVKNCAPGNYRLSGSLVQRGIDLPVANDALGQGEYSCSGSRTIRVEMPFGGEGLRPGYAKAYLSLRPFGCESKACSITSKRVVRVPGKITSIEIAPRTSNIYLYDASPTGGGVGEPTVSLDADIKNCPAGDYRYGATLVQNGVDVPMVQDSLGTGEVTCRGGALTDLGAAFTSPHLRPGYAKARFTVYPYNCESPACQYTATRVVRVPGKITSITLAPKASKIYRYDQGSTGGPGDLTVATYAKVKNCPDGDYRFGGTLVQDGKYLASAEDSLGQGEMTCRGGTSTVPLSATFTSPKLHPGWAKATFYFAPYGCEETACSYQDKRVVRIPGKLPTR